MRVSRFDIVASCLGGALLAAVPASAPAFRLMEPNGGVSTHCTGWYQTCEDEGPFLRWLEYVVPYHLNVDAAQDANTQGLTQADITTAMQLSFQAWEDVPAAVIQFAYAGETVTRISNLDGVSTTVWYNAEEDFFTLCTPGGGHDGGFPGWFARTIITENETEIIDVDVVCNTYVGYTWEWNPQAPSCLFDVIDLQAVLTHEYGHFIGIDHSDFEPEDLTLRPTMAPGWCHRSGAKRTLEPDDEAAAACLYPQMPTVILVDQSGSMMPGGKMQAAQGAASDFIDAFSDNLAAVATFADADEGCPGRVGYELLQDWTEQPGLLQAAVTSTSACGMSPLWEATCCAISKAQENAPSNLLIVTDAAENSSNGLCSCVTCCMDFDTDVLPHALASDVAVYVIDLASFLGATATAGLEAEKSGPGRLGTSPSLDLETLAEQTGGLYFNPNGSGPLLLARLNIQRHMAEFGKARQNPPAPPPGPFPIGTIQNYAPPGCAPNSPHAGQSVTIFGQVTVARGTFDGETQYVEDRTGGIQCFAAVGAIGAVGDSVSVVGRVNQSSGEIRISPIQSYSILSKGTLPGLPTVVPTRARLCEAIGRLIKVEGYVASPVANSRFQLSNTFPPDPLGLSGVTVYIDPDVGIDATALNEGDRYRVRGVVAQSLGQNEIWPRGPSDLDVLAAVGIADELAGGAGGETDIRSMWPNPSRGEMEITYAISSAGRASLRIFDTQGRLVRSLVDAPLAANRHSVRWDGRNERGDHCASGVYYVRLEGPDDVSKSKQIVILR